MTKNRAKAAESIHAKFSGGDNGDKPQEGKSPRATSDKTPKPLKASSIDEAVSVVVSPKTFQMSSTLLWQALQAAINEWGWPKEMTPEQFLDTYLYISFKQRGILLGGYQVIPNQEENYDEYSGPTPTGAENTYAGFAVQSG